MSESAAPPRLVLASASPRRRELLALLGLEYEVIAPDGEEPLPPTSADPEGLAVRVASAKCLSVAAAHPDAVVIGADTLVVLGERLYGKPAGPEDAARMLRELSGRTHRVITGVAVAAGGGIAPGGCFACGTDVTFRSLHDAEIAAYAATGEPADKAGAYAVQGRGAVLVESVRGDYPNVVGLPLAPLALFLRRLGYRVLGMPGAAEL